MPEIDFALLAEHVRAENGLGYAIAAGVNKVMLQSVPSGLPAGVLLKLSLSPAERSRDHRIEFVFMGADGERLMQMNLVPPVDPSASHILIGTNFGLPIPEYGHYSLEILINDTMHKAFSLEATPLDG